MPTRLRESKRLQPLPSVAAAKAVRNSAPSRHACKACPDTNLFLELCYRMVSGEAYCRWAEAPANSRSVVRNPAAVLGSASASSATVAVNCGDSGRNLT
jgi:hypothetical protein